MRFKAQNMYKSHTVHEITGPYNTYKKLPFLLASFQQNSQQLTFFGLLIFQNVHIHFTCYETFQYRVNFNSIVFINSPKSSDNKVLNYLLKQMITKQWHFAKIMILLHLNTNICRRRKQSDQTFNGNEFSTIRKHCSYRSPSSLIGICTMVDYWGKGIVNLNSKATIGDMLASF